MILSRPMKRYKTKLMRVPVPFENRITKLTKKTGYKDNTDFLHEKGIPLFDNAEYLSDMMSAFNIFRRKK